MAAPDPPTGQLGLMVRRLQVRHHRSLDTALQNLGVSFVQWDALQHLHEHPGASLHDLARLTFQTDQSMGGLAVRMQARGLIERVPGPGRAVRHKLTPKGEHLRHAGAEIVQRVSEDSFAPLGPPERRSFDRLLRRLLGDDAPPPSGGRAT